MSSPSSVAALRKLPAVGLSCRYMRPTCEEKPNCPPQTTRDLLWLFSLPLPVGPLRPFPQAERLVAGGKTAERGWEGTSIDPLLFRVYEPLGDTPKASMGALNSEAVLLKSWLFCEPMPNRNKERVMEKERVAFLLCQAKGEHSRPMPKELYPLPQ